MKANVGTLDRTIRLILAAALLFIYFKISSGAWLDLVLIVAAAILLLTALAGTCPLYSLFGISSSRKKNQSDRLKVL